MTTERRRLLDEAEDESSSDWESLTGHVVSSGSTSLEVSNTTTNDPTWEFDEAVAKVGFGRYQYMLWFFLSLVAMSCGFNNMAMVFEGGEGGHTCKTPQNTNITQYSPGQCEYNKTTYFANNTIKDSQSNIECDSWVYNISVYNTTINSEWGLTCKREYLVDLSSTVYMLGFFTGCIILGDLADRFGRRLLLLSSALLTLAAALGAAFSPSYGVFCACRFFVGMGVAGTRNCSYIMAAELARPKDRGTLGLISDMTYSLAYMLTGVIFYLDPNWRKFQLYIALSHIFYLTYILFLPESPRWLLSQGKTEQTMKYFRTSAKVNGKNLPPDVTVILDLPPHKSHSTLDLVRTPNLRKVGLVSVVLWFIVSLVYFGMSYNVSNLEGSIYINNAILGGVELISNAVGIWIVKLGRPPAIVLLFSIAAASMLAMCFAQGSYWAIIILAMIGKFVISPCFSCIYISTTELYPTQTRTLALGTGSGVARLGGAVAPFIPLTFTIWKKFPYIIFTTCSLIAAITALLLPETKGRPLPDSIESAEKMNKIRCYRWRMCSCCPSGDGKRASAGLSQPVLS